ncbi:diaminopimelate epimerase [Flexibacter flexilis DSM 6793]|uniref:Diaminopimelate epimerase n=1 Tax=Flexibacter flexilis DSM 6793 TaxID=927664 RepID=A0A1I1J497_9BACT|nr:diaminopimelate epimerase [Flexibacter flexilis]SFC40773.1 diaminopimelate epimerase [Flexibacter flexilis DSM 6793]
MTIIFHKYQGTGNDFVMIDNRSGVFDRQNNQLVALLCHRRFGVGADGLILIQKRQDFDFEMIYFNADGYEGSMCGNGGRCAVAFAHTLGLFDTHTTFMATDGLHEATITPENEIRLKMQDVSSVERNPEFAYMNTGSPHYVTFSQGLTNKDVFAEGRAIRYNDRFAAVGTNVNFVEKQADNTLFVRTYERGVEDETYSCGTGVTAAALTASVDLPSPIRIKTLGGNLQVAFEAIDSEHFKNIFLIGPAQKVFEGTFEYSAQA